MQQMFAVTRRSSTHLRLPYALFTQCCLIVVFLLSGVTLRAQPAPPPLQITSPAEGTSVLPGETITVTVISSPAIRFTKVVVAAELPIGFSSVSTTIPTEVSLHVPTNATLGQYHLTALGWTVQGGPEESPAITINVESPANPLKIVVQPPEIPFKVRGAQIPLQITGTFPDGHTQDLSNSTRAEYATSSPNVATVDGHGIVTSVGAGSSQISVRYGTQSIVVPVSVVIGPAVTVLASPPRLWPPNGGVVPITVSGTIMDAGGGVRTTSARYAVTDAYGTIQPTGTVTLGPNGEYSILVSLEASRRGDDKGGRQYTIVVNATDNSGNRGSGFATVVVPHDQGR